MLSALAKMVLSSELGEDDNWDTYSFPGVKWEWLEVPKRLDGIQIKFPNPRCEACVHGSAHFICYGEHPGVRDLRLCRETQFNLDERVLQESSLLHEKQLLPGTRVERLELMNRMSTSYVALLSECTQQKGWASKELLCSVFFFFRPTLYIMQGYIPKDAPELGGSVLLRVINSFKM